MKKLWIVALFLGALVIWGLWGYFGIELAGSFIGSRTKAVGNAGSWGDSFGAFTAAISTLGTLLVLVTLNVQLRAIAEQSRDVHRQRFESHFFELLKLARELKTEMNYTFSKDFIKTYITPHNEAIAIFGTRTKKKRARTINGHKAINAALADYRFWILKHHKHLLTFSEMGIAYADHIHPRAEPTFSPYFRLIYTMLDRLRTDKILNDEEKHQYARLLRSQLSSHDLTMIAVNATSKDIAKDMSSLLVEYRMLKYLPQSSLYRRLRHAYGDEAFMPRD